MSRRRRKRAVGGLFFVGGLLAVTTAALALPLPLSTSMFTTQQSAPATSADAVTSSPTVEATVAQLSVSPTATALPEEAPGGRQGPLAAPRAGVVNYIVRSGDTLMELADRYDTSVEELLKDNHGLDPAKIRAGQLIKVPDKLAAEGLNRPDYIWPADGPITTPFGERGSAWIGGYHPGLDIGATTGDYVWAAGEGVVAATAKDGLRRGYGTYVLIYHYDGWSTLYAHLSKVYRPAGYHVRQGEPIAEVGDTGFSLGPHLHFEVWRDGERQDPIQFLP